MYQWPNWHRCSGWHVQNWQIIPAQSYDSEQTKRVWSRSYDQPLYKGKPIYSQGLWIWKKPLQGLTTQGEPINVLVVDSEGMGGIDEDSNHDTRIFSLAILFSSYFIYNSVGSIDENAISNLSLVVNLTKHIHIKTGAASDDIDPDEYS